LSLGNHAGQAKGTGVLMADARVALIRDWLADELGWPRELRLEPASADASFRRYFRIWNGAGRTRIVMDAPPDKEDTGPYLQVSGLLRACGVHVPAIEAADVERGFLLLEDLGGTHMLARLRAGGDPAELYGEALAALELIQVRGAPAVAVLAPYDAAALRREMELLPAWFCARHLGLELSSDETGLLADTFGFLERDLLAQPVVFVHRDYHSRNLMITPRNSPGIIDFQDARAGPIGYDLVSLLKDCYISWPRAQQLSWLADHRLRLEASGVNAGADDAEFQRWFDLAGLQRHLKVLGIFARLWYRDGKPDYLPDLPLTLHYVREAASRYGELRAFSGWVEARLAPGLAAANERAVAGAGA
jgi:aminoglycoside/choline kinase family phosphotransferase